MRTHVKKKHFTYTQQKNQYHHPIHIFLFFQTIVIRCYRIVFLPSYKIQIGNSLIHNKNCKKTTHKKKHLAFSLTFFIAVSWLFYCSTFIIVDSIIVITVFIVISKGQNFSHFHQHICHQRFQLSDIFLYPFFLFLQLGFLFLCQCSFQFQFI